MKVWSMFCKHCGQAIERGHRFCGNCGEAISQEQIESEAVMAEATNAATASDAATNTPTSSPARSTSEVGQPLLLSASQSWDSGIPRPKEPPPIAPEEKVLPLPVAPEEKVLCPRCKKLNGKEDKACKWCGRELRWSTPPQGVIERSGLSFAGYAEPKTSKKIASENAAGETTGRREVPLAEPPARGQVVRRRSSLPLVEILVAILLLGGAATAVWIMRSSLPPASVPSTAKIKVTVSPAIARIAKNKSLEVLASVTGTDDLEVNWSVQEGEAGGHIEMRGAKAAKGNVWSEALYSAPKTPGIYHVVAASKADPTKSAAIAVTVVNR